jgi:hypothetical protein
MNPQRDGAETLEETRLRLQQQINALRQKRNTYAAYGDPVSGDRLLDAISELERQLGETHKPGRKPTTQREDNNDRTA